MKTFRIHQLALALLAVMGIVSGCGSSASGDKKEEGAETVKVGILHSLSGTMAISEVSLKDVVQMAIEEINAKGGVLGKQINQGKIDFKRTWGNRQLEDDWRRSSRPLRSIAGNNGANATDSSASVAGTAASTSMKKGDPQWQEVHDLLKKNIPLSDQQFADSQKKKEDALYNLGKIYRFDLKESQRAITTFERVLADFPKTQYKDEIYYLLYLSYEDNNQNKTAWKDKLLSEYPTSTYARLVNKSTDAAGSANSGNPVKEYEAVYKLYTDGNFTKALEDIEQNLPAYKGSSMEDKFALLRVFLIGKVRGKEAYSQAITEFMRLYPSSIYLPRLKEMQEFNSLSMGKR